MKKEGCKLFHDFSNMKFHCKKKVTQLTFLTQFSETATKKFPKVLQVFREHETWYITCFSIIERSLDHLRLISLQLCTSSNKCQSPRTRNIKQQWAISTYPSLSVPLFTAPLSNNRKTNVSFFGNSLMLRQSQGDVRQRELVYFQKVQIQKEEKKGLFYLKPILIVSKMV